jgi:broad specificity phosphatase PhoE
VAHDASTRIVLIRHAHTAAVGQRLVGRLPGVCLSDVGREQLPWLRDTVARWHPEAVYTSPLQRARETADAIASSGALPVRADDRLTEMDFGEWTGRAFVDLDALPQWQQFNTRRSEAQVPGGESARQMQERVVAALDAIVSAHHGRTIAAVSHADVIRAAILHYVGASLDCVHRVTIDPASVSVVALTKAGPRILLLNWCESPGGAS